MNNTENQEVFEAEAAGAVDLVKVPAQKVQQVHHDNEFPFDTFVFGDTAGE